MKIFAVILAAGGLYALFYLKTGIGIPCMFRLVTGLKCPGCGVTHMCAALLHMDFKAAWESNPAIFSMLPAGAVLFVYTVYVYIREGRWPGQRWYNIIIGVMIAVMTVFGVVRNLT
ncbi:MAG: DUF2752 domain-containing protein [Clostridiales bacterium]|nr:DUF2752 domain-containing protein [Clostridiales bacterium]MDY3745133.1 DUF2752 domain-containing protein [Lachnospiraceae bacterium]